MHWRDQLCVRLQEIRPANVCALDATAWQLAADALPDTPLHPPGQPCALALGIDMLDGLDAQQARQRISQTRLYIAPRMLIAARVDCALDAAGFRALGFACFSADSAESTRLYEYDIDTYKTVPDWLNARYWAHPERWEP